MRRLIVAITGASGVIYGIRTLEVLRECRVEPSLASAAPGLRVQFERLGYFCADLDSRPGALVFNRTVSLRDTWARIEQKETGANKPQRRRDTHE